MNRLAAGPESQKLQQQTASLTSSAARFAAVAEALPGTISAEREALIRQLNETLTTQAASLRPLLVEMRGTLEAGSAAAASVDRATRSIDALVARFAKKPGEPDTGKPFDVTEYTQAAAEIAHAATVLDQLDRIGRHAGAAARLPVDAGAAQGRSLVDYFFVRVAWLIALLCLGLLATLLLYRWLAPRASTTMNDMHRTIRAPRGTALSARSWLTEAPLRMLMNNLDPEVAERPDELVVYGGIGRAARNWDCYDRIVAALRDSATTRRCWCSRASRSACSARTRMRRAC